MTFFKKVKKQLNLLAPKILPKKKYNAFLAGSIVFSFATLGVGFYTVVRSQTSKPDVLGARVAQAQTVIATPVIEITIKPSATPTSTPTNTPTPTPKPKSKKPKNMPTPTLPTTKNPDSSKYTAEKIGDVTFRVEGVANDNSMASPQDIVNALNSYRGEKGLPNLSVDGTLSSFAQERANLFSSNGSLDSHAGFRDYMNNGGFEKSGFNGLGENSAFLSGPMNGDKIIRQIFGADHLHDGNQLDNWTHVGVGVSGNAINVNFGKNKR